uniref:F-box domain-containing protein n=1 Tax=Mycena chlorophos TaxID=658473 RepID=A0ABQ0LS90_MYCCL|nr:predicted protein [Mycena chlorophos]
MLQLPPELLSQVFCSLPIADLPAVARVTTTLYPIALRSLYRSLSIADASGHAILSVLVQKPEVAAFVRKFSLADVVLCPHQLKAALANMKALTSLDLFVDGIESWILPSGLVSPQLRHFGTSMPYDDRVAAFCAGAQHLETIHLASIEFSGSVDAHAFPRMSTFTGSAAAAIALVPGRPVESIFITSGDLSEDLVPFLAKSSANVAILSAQTNSIPLLVLHALGRHLSQNLAYLQLNSTRGFPAPPTTMFYEEVSDALALFPSLRSFELSGMYWPSQVHRDDKRAWQSQPLPAHDLVPELEIESDDFILSW